MAARQLVQELGSSLVAARDLLDADPWPAVLAVVGRSRGLDAEEVPPAVDAVLAPWAHPDAVEHLAAVHESSVAGRHDSGTFYTPPALVAWVLDRCPTRPASVLDPACGAGHFLVAAVRRLVADGVPPSDAVGRVHGVDLDPVAVAIARLRLRLEAPDGDPAVLERQVRVGDGLAAHPAAPFTVVLGNPPFGGQLRTRTARPPVPGLGAYTDLSAVFLRRCLDLVEPDGVVALVQPLSLLSARDAAPVRSAVASAGAVTDLWASGTPVFPGTPVLTCAPVLRAGAVQGEVATWHGATPTRGVDAVLPAREWGPLAATALGIPAVRVRSAGTLGDLGLCTADFRDQYYGLVPFVRDGGAGARLVTAGLIDPATCHWGERPTRFAKVRYDAPTVDLEALHADGALSAWVLARRVPKVLVATQGPVIEAVVDAEGTWLPSVPVLTLVPPPDRLWHALAVLLAPPVVAHAAARYLGSALTAGAIKLSARQLAALPLPAVHDAWDEGADLARRAQLATPAERPALLRACATVMGPAYGDASALEWWLTRISRADNRGTTRR